MADEEQESAGNWLLIGVLHESQKSFASVKSLSQFWKKFGQSSRWVVPARKVCISTTEGAVIAVLERGKPVEWDEVVPVLADGWTSITECSATGWLDGSVGELLTISHEFGDKNARTSFLLGGEIKPSDRRTIKSMATVLMVQAGLTHQLLTTLEAQRETEKELRKATWKAEAAARAKSEFLANMSHEIRTPLNAVIGLAGLLSDTQLDDDQREIATTIRNSGDSLLTIINDILDFSKAEAGKIELEERPFFIHSLLESALEVVATTASDKGLELLNKGPRSGDPIFSCKGDSTRVRQVLVNLLSNAVKFTETGEVTLEYKSEPVGDLLKLWFWVTDSGIGIPKERKDRLFQSFSQVDAGTTRRFGGTGLGLAISRNLVELMGGEISAHSEGEGKGTTFEFYVMVEPDSTLIADEDSDVSLVGRRVLIVDDNATNRRILERQLSGWKCETHLAASGAEAIEMLANHTFDFCIVDMQMPHMDGAEFVQTIRVDHSAHDLPAILLSSIGAAPEKRLFSACLRKPVRRSELLDAIQQAITGKKKVRRPDSSIPDAISDEFPMRVLAVEDNQINQMVLRRMLERLGYRADFAGNGQEAIFALRRQPYDVVLMDLQMPEMGGIEATTKIREEFSADRQPHIIALTAEALQGDAERCINAGMDDYTTKPLRFPDLVRVLKRASETRELD